MAHPHIKKTLDAIKQQWLGGAYGQRYATQLEQALRTRNKQAVDGALSLGHYLVHSQANKQKRAAIRAVLLAELTVGGRRLGERDVIYAKLKSQPQAQLVARFRKSMGLMWDNGKRSAWAPCKFTAPDSAAGQALQVRQNWIGKSLPQFKFLIHSLLGGSRFNSSIGLLADPATTLSGWDAISCSLISNNKPHPYGDFGLILRVSERNILTASPADQQFRNHIGTARGRTAQEGTGGLHNQGLLMSHIAEKNAETGGLRTPAQVLSAQATSINGNSVVYHSEVVVVGRSGVNFGAGATRPVQVSAVFRRVKPDGTPYHSLGRAALTQQQITLIDQAANQLNVPLLYIPDPVRH